MSNKLFLSIACLAGLTFCVACSNESDTQNMVTKIQLSQEELQKVSMFESQYINRFIANETRSKTSNQITLIGYTTIAYHGEDSIFVNKLWTKCKNEIEEAGYFLPLDGKVRVYYPLREAIVTIDGHKYTADSCGIVYLKKDVSLYKTKLLGRAKTAKSVETKFCHGFTAEKEYESTNVIVYDFGVKKLCCENKHSAPMVKTNSEQIENDKVSCRKNHLPYRNCTEAFGCYQGRCKINYNRCMDYNGFYTDCSGSKKYFVGSDCSVAMAQGHCWNEVM